MCGIVGMMGDFRQAHKDMMRLLLYLDTLRGEDSTGVSAVRVNGEIDTFKLTIPGYDFIRLERFRDHLRLTDDVWIGHNRFKTTGVVNRLNAHPFEVKDETGDTILVGAHNGTLSNKWEIPNERQFGTDSEALFNHIAEVGIKDAIAKVRGAWSLVWFDFWTDTLNFLRNKERPMCYVMTDDEKVLIFASEDWMIKAAAERCSVKLDKFWFPNEDFWIKFKLPEHKGPRKIGEPVFEGGLVGAPLQKNFPAYANEGVWSGYNHPGPDKIWRNGRWFTKEEVCKTSEEGSEKGTQKVPEVAKETKNVDLQDDTIVLPLDLVKKGFEGKAVDANKIKLVGEAGCGWCGDIIDTKANPFAWLDEETMVCHRCIRGTHPSANFPDDEDNPAEDAAGNVIQLTALQESALRASKVGKKVVEKVKGGSK